MKLPARARTLSHRLATGWRRLTRLIVAARQYKAQLSPIPTREHLRATSTHFAIIFGLFATIILVGNHIVLNQRKSHELENLKRQETDSLDSVQRLITDRLNTGLQDILFLKELPELESYAESLDREELQLLGLDLIGLMQIRDDYDKLRIINTKGMEIMRIEYRNGNPRPVPDSELQDKKASAYVRVGLQLKPQEVYMSPFELNKVYGVVEIPHKPTFRLISGVFNKKNELICMIVINYLGDNLLDDLDARTSNGLGLWMMSDDGCWMKEPDHAFESDPSLFSSLLNRLGTLRPVITGQQSGQKLTRHGLYTFRHFNPLAATIKAHPKLSVRLSLTQAARMEDWIVVSQITASKLREIDQFFDRTNALILFLILAPGAFGAWVLSHALVLKKESDHKSKEARDALQQVTDSIPGAVYKIDLYRDGHGTFLFQNYGTREIFGLSATAPLLSYEQFLATIIPTDRHEYDRTILESLSTGIPWECDFRIYDGNSCLKWIRTSATIMKVTKDNAILSGIFTDNTSLKVAEIKRRASEERLDLALQAANDGLWDWNVAEGSIYFSIRWLQMLGYDSHELPHHFNTWKTLLHPDDLKPTLRKLSTNIENKTDHYEMEFRMRTKDGGWKWILSRGAVVERDPLGRPERMIGTHTDISERKELEKSLKAAKEVAEQSNKTKSTFLAIMSHELRTPMNSVCGFADSLKRTALNPDQAGYVEKIEKSAGKLLFIINDILDYSKIEAGRLKLEAIPFDAIYAVRETTEMLRPQLDEKHIQFELQVEGPESLTVKGDPVRLHQIVVNLLANAIKFTDHGRICLRLHSRPVDDHFCELEISVQDSGIGMSVEQQAVLFQPFSQVDSSTTRKYGGTGLGLAICKRLCEMMNGHIWVVSQPGEGSTFTFSVQLEKTTAAQTATSSLAASPNIRKSSASTSSSRAPQEKFAWKVLLADHDPVSRMVATELLREIGCEVQVIEDSDKSLTPEQVRGCTAMILDEAAIKTGLCHEARQQVKQLGIQPFYYFGMAEGPVSTENSAEQVDAWISQPVDIRNLSRAFSKATKDSRGNEAALAALQ